MTDDNCNLKLLLNYSLPVTVLLQGLGRELMSVSGTWMCWIVALHPWAQTMGVPLAQGIPGDANAEYPQVTARKAWPPDLSASLGRVPESLSLDGG